MHEIWLAHKFLLVVAWLTAADDGSYKREYAERAQCEHDVVTVAASVEARGHQVYDKRCIPVRPGMLEGK